MEDLKCEGCGGDLAIDKTGEIGTCIFCGRKRQLVEKTKTVIEHTGKVEVDGIATVEAKLASAHNYIVQDKIDNANKIYEEILNIEPKNAFAWWGRYTCEMTISEHYGFKDKYGHSGLRVKANILENNLKFAESAVEYAEGDVKKGYEELVAQRRDEIQKLRDEADKIDKRNRIMKLVAGAVVAVIVVALLVKCCA